MAVILIAPGAFGADGAVSRVIPTIDTEAAGEDTSGRGTTVARTATRVVSGVPKKAEVVEDNNKPGVAVRGAVSRVFSGATDAPAPQSVAARSAVVARSGDVARSNLSATVNTVGRNKRVSDASINSNPTVRRAGLVLRPSTAEVGGRATIGDTGVQTGSNIDEQVRSLKMRAAKEINAETIAQATERLEQTATLNKSCQEQYNDCMDQFCAVIDANQGRCSCSSNLSRYTKVEEAVKDANNQLNEVAQRIRYVGLSADEIRAILTETEAEEALSGTTDTSETRNMLEQIEELIRDPVSNTSAVYSGDDYSDFGLDMNLDFSSESMDLFNLDFLGTGTSGSFSNLRGTELYNAAKKRCKTVLNQCKEAGSTVSQITGNYDLAIDKDCIAYEKGLIKMNETLLSNVGSANRMLQKARLAVLQNKNMYDAKGCIAALETCMTDEMVCGEKYFKCVDPTKIYIDENGNVVLGQNISKIKNFMSGYNNALIDGDFLQTAYGKDITESYCGAGGKVGHCNAKYLLQKIGTKQKVTDEGLCRAVLDKCQRYTYDDNGNYIRFNDVVVNYIQRALVNIRAAQSKIISEYASTCIVDVADCYNSQVTQVNAWSSNANVTSIQAVLAGACRNVALTCGYAVFSSTSTCSSESNCIKAISTMFYQSLLCPENSTYTDTSSICRKNVGNGEQCVNERCRCNNGYVAWGNACVLECGTNQERDSYGVCQCKSGFVEENGQCVAQQSTVTAG